MNYQGIIDNIVDLASDKLNDWESDFIDDISTKYFNKMEKLSDTQKSIIREIQNKYLKHN